MICQAADVVDDHPHTGPPATARPTTSTESLDRRKSALMPFLPASTERRDSRRSGDIAFRPTSTESLESRRSVTGPWYTPVP